MGPAFYLIGFCVFLVFVAYICLCSTIMSNMITTQTDLCVNIDRERYLFILRLNSCGMFIRKDGDITPSSLNTSVALFSSVKDATRFLQNWRNTNPVFNENRSQTEEISILEVKVEPIITELLNVVVESACLRIDDPV